MLKKPALHRCYASITLILAGLASISTFSVIAKEKEVDRETQERVQTIFETTYADICRSLMPDQNMEPSQPTVFEMTFNYGDEDFPPRPYLLFQFLCFEGPYNQGFVYYGVNDYQEIAQIQFARPTFEVIRESDDYESAVTAINVTGYKAFNQVTNADFDPETLSLYSFDKWRGPADAFSSGHWIFRDGAFVLNTYDVDASYDGARSPQRIFGAGQPAEYD